jgi:hypothetical protein
MTYFYNNNHLALLNQLLRYRFIAARRYEVILRGRRFKPHPQTNRYLNGPSTGGTSHRRNAA